MYRFIHIASAGGSSASETPNSDMCMSAVQLTFRSPAAFAMRSWRKALRKSTAGSPIQGGLRFTSGMKETSSTLCGLMRLSYLRYALKTASDSRGMMEHESEVLGLSPHLTSLLQQHLPTKAESVTADPLTA